MEDVMAGDELVRRYVELIGGGGSTDEIVGLYAADAVLEDPVGSEPRRGHAAIREFYAVLEPLDREAELVTSRIIGTRAAFLFRLTTRAGGRTMDISPIDVMEFDDAGKIVSMQAYWGPDDLILR
ncbi:nuclear transport factor 2 family protein [Skermania piniformis]|uniref:Nuclear transport factor 2 family protein n=1 Tax=Skermania pinensis TaxID=39122 RepID=A0ABX8SDR1_9ACTN|nr:nuclear transport factor 2 family protein [Skermania piniformis]